MIKHTFIGRKNFYKLFIWASYYQLSVLAKSKNLHVDATFKVPEGFGYLLIIMVEDLESKYFLPVVYALCSDSRVTEAYIEFFKSLKEILTKNKLVYNFRTITLDFEAALHSATKIEFPEVKINGCYFHFIQALWRKGGELGYKKEEKLIRYNNLLSKIKKLFYCDLPQLDNEYQTIKNEFQEEYKNFFIYFENVWLILLQQEIIHYKKISSTDRCNSCLEGYNGVVSQSLIKNSTSIKFLQFIKNEEEKVRHKNFNYLLTGEKNIKYDNKNYFPDLRTKNLIINSQKRKSTIENIPFSNSKILKTGVYTYKEIILDKNDSIEKLKWLQWNNYSCRYDTFLSFFV